MRDRPLSIPNTVGVRGVKTNAERGAYAYADRSFSRPRSRARQYPEDRSRPNYPPDVRPGL
ncbi:hypothetical protein T484DRAFT_1945105 [Baffinella frigidus]|nr:hypothetical protein T484DRAFT_1945105 [Cryptophyta sp. CCMP2293]